MSEELNLLVGIVCTTIIIVVAIIAFSTSTKKVIEKGYTQKQVCSEYSTIWVKE